jgi:hypothetical protein
MWIPGGFVYVLAAAIVFVKWLQEVERHASLPPLSLRPAGLAVLMVVAAALPPLAGCGDSDPPDAVAGLGNASNGPR